MPSLGAWEWLIIAAIILLLFGAKRMPDAARGLGRSLRIFKAETKGLSGSEPTEVVEISTVEIPGNSEVPPSSAEAAPKATRERLED